jgi:hypothetical protein
MTRKTRPRKPVARADVAGAIGAELRKRFARMSDAELGRLFLFLSTGKP